MSDEMEAELNEFLNSIMAESKEKLKEQFRNNMEAARVFKEAGLIEPMTEWFSRAKAIALFLGSIKR